MMKRARIAAVMAVGALGACSSGHGLTPGGGIVSLTGAGGATGAGGTGGAVPGQTVLTFHSSVNRNVDVIFMIDESAGMPPVQVKLTRAISSYFDLLKGLPGGLPNLHIGVLSPNMGAGRNPSIPHCPQGGDQGVFQTTPLGGAPCTRASLNPGQNFIIDVNGQPNYQGDIADVFGCIALLGSGGCMYKHQFESVLRALGADGAPGPPENANFLRSDAYLQIVLVTDADDCSAPPDSDLFDSSSMTVADPLGPLQSYRCNEFGHLCGGKPPPRQPTGEVTLSGCVSAEDGRLIKVADAVTALRGLKADPSKVLVAAITGPTTPYNVNVGPPEIKTDPSMWPYVEHSCTQSEPDGSMTFAAPSVRIAQFINGFGANGVLEELCTPTFEAPLQAIASQIGKVLGPPCFPANVQPDKCHLVDAQTNASGAVITTPLARCKDAADPGPCWDVQLDTPVCAQLVVFRRPGAPASSDVSTTATCAP
jgi:hypothetical protein